MSRQASAWEPTWMLLDRLRRAGWGEMSRREWQGARTALSALVSRLDYDTGWGKVTVPQLADAACLSPRWLQKRCLPVLEELGLVQWVKAGEIVDGRATPSVVRLVKSKLVEFVEAAHPIKAVRDHVRKIATSARIAKLKTGNIRNRRSQRANSVRTSLTEGGYIRLGGAPDRGRRLPIESGDDIPRLNKTTEQLKQQLQNPSPAPILSRRSRRTVCPHGRTAARAADTGLPICHQCELAEQAVMA